MLFSHASVLADSLLTAEPTIEGSKTHTFSNAVAAVLVVLALCGVAYILTQTSRMRIVALLVLIGIVIVSSDWAKTAGTAVRDGIVTLGNNYGFSELVSGTIFTVVIAFALYIVAQQIQKRRNDPTAEVHPMWYIALVILALVFFTFSWAQEAIVRVSDFASWLLDLLAKL